MPKRSKRDAAATEHDTIEDTLCKRSMLVAAIGKCVQDVFKVDADPDAGTQLQYSTAANHYERTKCISLLAELYTTLRYVTKIVGKTACIEMQRADDAHVFDGSEEDGAGNPLNWVGERVYADSESDSDVYADEAEPCTPTEIAWLTRDENAAPSVRADCASRETRTLRTPSSFNSSTSAELREWSNLSKDSRSVQS